MRVVSLVPSITETLLVWGVEPVAVTRFCEQPDLPTVGGTKNPDLAAIVALAPDLVVVDEEENRRPDAEALVDAGIDVHVTAVRSVADVAPALVDLARRVDVEAPSIDLGSPAPPTGDVVFVPIWRRPWMTINADTYGASVLDHVGVTTAFASADDRYPTLATLDEARTAGSTVALVPTEPYAFGDEHLAEIADALGAPAVLVDGKDLFWWGVRTPAAIERLAAQIGALVR